MMPEACDASHPYLPELTPAQLRDLQTSAAAQAGPASLFHDSLDQGGSGPDLAVIPAGVMELGADDAERSAGELPRRYVRIERPYALGQHCVSAEQFEAFADAVGLLWPAHLMRAEGREPMFNFDRHLAQRYLDWLSDQTGQHYRLPSEDEWEYAARAGSLTRYCYGNELGCGEANTGSYRLEGNSPGWRRFLPFCAPMQKAVPGGLYPPNIWDLFDMHGNVWEFTSTPWQGAIDALHRAGTQRTGHWFVTKGGSWFDTAWHARSAARKPRQEMELDTNLGLRVLREL